jgi:mycothiol synthase
VFGVGAFGRSATVPSVVALTWRSRLTEDETTEVLALLAAVTEADGLPPVSEQVLLQLRHGECKKHQEQGEHLLAYGDEGLVGYAHLDSADEVTGPTGELAVHPAHRRRGVAGQMVRALRNRADGEKLRLWAHGEHPAAKKLAQRYGFTKARVLWQMRRSLWAPLDSPTLPDGVRLRPFVVGQDEAAFVEVNNKAFAWHPEQGGWDVEQVRVREAEPWFDADGFLLAVEATDETDATRGRLLGFHWTKAHSAELGEVYVLGVDPAEHGRGLGKALTLAGLHYLRGRGMSTVMLYVEAENAPAIKTYQRLGFTHWDTDVAFSLP